MYSKLTIVNVYMKVCVIWTLQWELQFQKSYLFPVAAFKCLQWSDKVCSIANYWLDNWLINVYWFQTGEFGIVYKGIIKQGGTHKIIAVKALKGEWEGIYCSYYAGCLQLCYKTVTNFLKWKGKFFCTKAAHKLSISFCWC